MRIALVAPPDAPIVDDDASCESSRWAIADLARGLAERNHEVVLLAPDGSQIAGVETPALGIRAAPSAPGDPSASAPRDDDAFERVRAWLDAQAAPFDIVHALADRPGRLGPLDGAAPVVVHTLRRPPRDPDLVAAARAVVGRAILVSVWEASRAAGRAADVPTDRVHDGIDVRSLPFGVRSRGYLAWAGPMAPTCGAELAVEAARGARLPLVVAGPVEDAEYFDQQIAPRVLDEPDWLPRDPISARTATYVGPRSRSGLRRILASAAGLLLPTDADASAGMLALEAQATGCPVVAFAHGGLPELVADGRTGILAPPGDIAVLADAARRLPALDRATCREWVGAHFGLDRTLAAYEALYRRGGGGRGTRAVGLGGWLAWREARPTRSRRARRTTLSLGSPFVSRCMLSPRATTARARVLLSCPRAARSRGERPTCGAEHPPSRTRAEPNACRSQRGESSRWPPTSSSPSAPRPPRGAWPTRPTAS